MLIPNIPDRIRYTITPSDHGVTLCVWEDRSTAQADEKRFLFKINQRVASHEEAQALLSSYLENVTAG